MASKEPDTTDYDVVTDILQKHKQKLQDMIDRTQYAIRVYWFKYHG